MLRRFSAVCFLALCSGSVLADAFDVSLSDESANFKYYFDTTNVAVGGADRGFGVFFNEGDDFVGTFEFLVTGNVIGTNRSLQLGAGFKTYLGSLDDAQPGGADTIAAVAIGARLNYVLPARQPMAVFTELYIAPNITAFADSEKVFEFSAGYEIEVAPSTKLYMGYRKLEAEFEGVVPEYELDDTAFLGIRIRF